MSSYWQGKGAGSKIVIKFDKALLGDVSGNEGAFTVTGFQRNPLRIGPLQPKEYAVDSVERYPIATLFEDDFEGGEADGVELGPNGLRLESAALQAFTAVGSHSFAVPEGVTEVDALVIAGGGGGGSRQGGGGGGAGGLIFAAEYDVTGETEILVTVGAGGSGGGTDAGQRGQNGGNSGFGSLVAIGGGGGGPAAGTGDTSGAAGGSGGGAGRSGTFNTGGTSTSGQGNPGGDNTTDNANSGGGGGAGEPGEDATASKSGDGGDGLYFGNIFGNGLGDSGWFAGGGGGATINGSENETGIGGKGGGGDAGGNGENGLTNTGGGGGGGGRTETTGNFAGGSGGSGIVIVKWGEDASEGTYAPPPIDTSMLPSAPRIRFEGDTPDGTSVTVEYACTDDDETPPETWMSVDDEDLLTIDDAYLWLRYTLETEDTSKTPTLLAVWLEEAEAPPDTILLTMTPDSRFNDVEGDLTISYERAKGTLTGNRPVEDFTESFTPTGLEPTPVDEHTITAKATDLLIDFIGVTHHDFFSPDDHIITARACNLSIELIRVEDIPP